MRFLSIAATAILAMTFSGTAHAAFINGSLSLTDGFDVVPSPADSTCIVACGTGLYDIATANLNPPAPSGDFAGTAAATASDINTGNVPFDIYVTDTGFTFTATSFTISSESTLTCTGGLCVDSIGYIINGTVSNAGFDDTAFVGVWTANGSCGGANGECTANVTGSWSVSLTALGTAVPAPATLALFGLGLAGLGFSRRRT